MSYQLSLFADVQLEGRPEKCPRCGGELRLAYSAFTSVSPARGFYEVSCVQCLAKYRLYRNREEEAGWKLLSPSQDRTWCVDENW